MKVLNRSQLLAIFLTLTLFAIFLFTQMSQNDILYSLNPWTQRFFTDFGEPQQLFTQAVSIQSGDLVLPHPSLLRTNTYLLSEVGQLDSFQIYQFGSIILRIIYTILVMMIVITMTGKVQYALVICLIIFTSPFFIFRSHVLIPQNVTVLFFLLMIWGFEKYRKTGRIIFLSMVMLSLLGNAVYDPTSIMVSGIIIVSYTALFLANEDLRKTEMTYFSLLIVVVLLLPMFDTLLQVIQTTFTRFGDNSIWAQYVKSPAGTLTPLVNTYFEIIGYPVSIFSVLGIFAIVWRSLRQYIHLLVMLGLILLFMVNLSPQPSLTPSRMQDYIYIPLLLISAVYVSVLFSRTGRLIRMALISLLITMSLATMIKNPPWIRLNDGTLGMANSVNSLLNAEEDTTVFIEADAMFLTNLIRHPDQVCAYWDPVFQWYRPPVNNEIPDCTQADYRVRLDNQPIVPYQFVQQIGDYSLFERSQEG